MSPLLIPTLLGSLVLGALGLGALRRLGRGAPIPRRPREVPWGWSAALLALVLPVLLGAWVHALGGRLGLGGGGQGGGGLVRGLAAQAIGGGLAAGLLLLAVARPGRFRPEHLGLQRRGLVRSVLTGWAGWLAYLPVYWGANLANLGIHRLLGRPVGLQGPVVGLAREADPWGRLAAFLLVCAAIPLFEEIAHRGVIYGALRRVAGPRGAALASAFVFAGLHDPSAFVPILALGLLLAWLYERTGSLAAPVAAHALHNGVTAATILLFPRAVGGG